MKTNEEYTDTTGSLARVVPTSQPTIRKYCDMGLLDFIEAANGTRLLRTGQADKVRAIIRERMANRGRWGKA